MPDAPHVNGDLFTAEAGRIGDQPAMHDAMRRAGPVVQVEAFAGGPAWVVTEDSLARQILADPRFAKDPALAPAHWHGRDPALEPPAAQVPALTTLDGAEHRRLRHVHAPLLTRRRVLTHHHRITDIARDLLTHLAAESAHKGQPVDLISGFTGRYPLLVICDLLGVPLTNLDRAAHASQLMTHGDADDAQRGLAELESLIAEAIHTSHQHSTDTLTHLLAERARADFGDISDGELLYMITGLIFAGQVTTESFLGFLLAHQLAGHHVTRPGDDHETGDDEAIEAFVSETLRLHPPAPFTLWRFTTTEVNLAGATLPAGAPIVVDIQGINLDPAIRTAPHLLDPNRPRLPDLSFGDGPHACIAAQLAHLEARTAVTVLRQGFPHARLAVPFDELERDHSVTQARRLISLPAWLTPSAT